MIKKKVMLTLAIIFAILTFIGIGYIFYTDGNANAGFACVPMVFELICVAIYKKIKNE